jgi:DHA2 family methylenomycin A resistance protein-like MFS transporter
MERRNLLLPVLCVGYFLVLLDVTIVNVALPRIGHDLHTGVDGQQWVVDGYAVVLAALLLVGGTVGDVHGHRRVVLTGLALFGVASLGCGLAPGTGALVAGRVAQGVGAALLLPGTLAMIADAFPDRAEQARAIGTWAAVGSTALPAGPLLGGALVQATSWRAVFLVNVPVVLAAGVAVARSTSADHPRTDRRVDWAGSTLAGLALAATVYAVIEAGRHGATTVVVVAAVLALGLGAALVAVERRAPDPMLPPDLFRRPGFAAANAVAGAMNLGTLGLLFVVTLDLQSVQGRSPFAAGVALLPLFLPLTVLAPFAGRLTARTGPPAAMVAGLVVAAAGVGLLVRVTPDSPYLTWLPALLAWGIGLGLLTPAVVAAAVAAVHRSRSGLASGVNNTARQACGAVGIAVYGSVSGPPGRAHAFTAGLQHLGLATAGLFAVAAVATVVLVPSAPDPATGTAASR